MADQKLSALATAVPVLADYIYGAQASGPTSKGFLFSDIKNLILQVFGGSNVVSVTGTVTATINKLHVCSGTTSNYTVNLPAASGNAGQFLAFIMDAALTKFVTLDGNASEKIDNALSRIMWAGETAILYCDGSNWFKIAGRSLSMACTISQTGGNQSISASTVTLVSIDTIILDNTGAMADVGSSKILSKRPSYYLISSGLSFANLSQISTRTLQQVQITTVAAYNTETYGPIGGYPTLQGCKVASMSAIDYSQLFGYQQTAVAQNTDGVSGVTYLSMMEIPQW
jgi:hypothetical protein